MIDKILKKFRIGSSQIKIEIAKIFTDLMCSGNVKEIMRFFFEKDIIGYYENYLLVETCQDNLNFLIEYICKMIEKAEKYLINGENLIKKRIKFTTIRKRIEEVGKSTKKK